MTENKNEDNFKFTKGLIVGSIFVGVLAVSTFAFAKQGRWRDEKYDNLNSSNSSKIANNPSDNDEDYYCCNNDNQMMEDHDWEAEELELVDTNDLTDIEFEMLQFMYEEEKLARDVYTTLSDMWGQRIFENISYSEQRHMDMVGELVKNYGIENSSVNDQVGVFTNSDLQSLYNTLIDQGEKSLVDALKVGATIEDVDIRDLEEYMEKTDNPNIEMVFQSLIDGSENHMRAFIRNLERQGGDYEAQFISKDRFGEILSSSNENPNSGSHSGGSMGGGRGRR